MRSCDPRNWIWSGAWSETSGRKSQAARGGRMYRVLSFKSRWGWMAVAESERGLAGIVLPQGSEAAAASGLGMDSASWERSSSDGLREAKNQLTEYLAGGRTVFDLPLDLSQGTPFQRRVWKTLR